MQKKENVKATVKEAVVTKVEEAKEATKEVKEATKEVAKKAAAKKPATPKKAAAPKKPTAKEAVKPQVIVQYQNNEVDMAQIEERVKAQFVSEGHKAGTIKKINIYVKPEEYSAYYVINEKFSGRVDLF